MDPVVIREARGRADYEACVDLQRVCWGLADLEITSTIQLVATVHAGGLLMLAESTLFGVGGFCYAFAALRGGEPHLHSDMLCVHPRLRGRGVGTALKWAQREEALRRGLRVVTWTFDPMRQRNANLNLRRLGAEARELVPDFYGPTTSALHQGLPTDRLLVRWELDSPRVRGRAGAGDGGEPPRGGPLAFEIGWRDGLPVAGAIAPLPESPRVLVEVPADWDAVCRADASAARDWQATVRASFLGLFGRGYVATDFVVLEEAGRPHPRYVLERNDVR
jgi:predicted GNAT superfamily acetyltransferase